MVDEGMEIFTLPLGLIIHVCGFPVELKQPTDVHAHPGTIAMIRRELQARPVEEIAVARSDERTTWGLRAEKASALSDPVIPPAVDMEEKAEARDPRVAVECCAPATGSTAQSANGCASTLEKIRALTKTVLIDSEWAELMRWRDRFLNEHDDETVLLPPPPQTVCYTIVDAMTLRAISDVLEAHHVEEIAVRSSSERGTVDLRAKEASALSDPDGAPPAVDVEPAMPTLHDIAEGLRDKAAGEKRRTCSHQYWDLGYCIDCGIHSNDPLYAEQCRLRASRAPQLTTEETLNHGARVDDHGHVSKPGTTA